MSDVARCRCLSLIFSNSDWDEIPVQDVYLRTEKFALKDVMAGPADGRNNTEGMWQSAWRTIHRKGSQRTEDVCSCATYNFGFDVYIFWVHDYRERAAWLLCHV